MVGLRVLHMRKMQCSLIGQLKQEVPPQVLDIAVPPKPLVYCFNTDDVDLSEVNTANLLVLLQ